MPLYSATTTTGTIWPLWVNATNTATTTAATSTVWRQWANGDMTGTHSTSTNTIWANWANNSTTITATGGGGGTGTIWTNWNNSTISASGIGTSNIIRMAPETPEMVAERRQREDNARRIHAEEEKKRILAEERATQLLVSVLSEEQKRDFAAHGYFFVDAPVSGRRYRIDKGRSGNIKVIDRVTGVWTESLCVHQRDYIPVPDTMLMQKLLLEVCEAEVRKVANITYRNGGFTPGTGMLDGERLAQVIPFSPRQAA